MLNEFGELRAACGILPASNLADISDRLKHVSDEMLRDERSETASMEMMIVVSMVRVAGQEIPSLKKISDDIASLIAAADWNRKKMERIILHEEIKKLLGIIDSHPAKAAPASIAYISTDLAAERAGVDKTTITRQCVKGKIPGAISPADTSNTTGGWKIPASFNPSRSQAKAAKPATKPAPSLAIAAVWACFSCDHEITSKTKPSRCPKCAKGTFTRKSVKSSAV